MIGEISIGGGFIPTLLLLVIAATALTFALMRLISAFGLYRFVAYRALVDLSLYVLVLGFLVWLFSLVGYRL